MPSQPLAPGPADWPEFVSRIVIFLTLRWTPSHAKTGSGVILSRCATDVGNSASMTITESCTSE